MTSWCKAVSGVVYRQADPAGNRRRRWTTDGVEVERGSLAAVTERTRYS